MTTMGRCQVCSKRTTAKMRICNDCKASRQSSERVSGMSPLFTDGMSEPSPNSIGMSKSISKPVQTQLPKPKRLGKVNGRSVYLERYHKETREWTIRDIATNKYESVPEQSVIHTGTE